MARPGGRRILKPTDRPTSGPSVPGLTAIVQVGGRGHEVLLSQGIDLSLPLSFSSDDPNLYGIPNAEKATFQAGQMIGDTRQGGSCNVDVLRLTPHCHGTHTECVGHITEERISIRETLPTGLIPCRIVSIEPESLCSAGETSRPALSAVDGQDLGVSARALRSELGDSATAFTEAIILRTLPNSTGKRNRTYAENGAPFLSIEAAAYLSQLGVRHILVDFPSIDRIFDDGEMAAHRTWWELEPGSHATPTGAARYRTITELVFVPNTVEDGIGFLSLHIPPFESDAAPSRPIFYVAHPVNLS